MLRMLRFALAAFVAFIAGLTAESKESHLRTVQILRENGYTEATFFPLVVFRGTPLYDQFVANKSPEEIERARFDEDSEEFCCLSEDFPTKEALIAWAGYLNSEIRKGAPDTGTSHLGFRLVKDPPGRASDGAG